MRPTQCGNKLLILTVQCAGHSMYTVPETIKTLRRNCKTGTRPIFH